MPPSTTLNEGLSAPDSLGETLGVGQFLEADHGHRVWWCEGGDPAGVPVLIVHGGPGGRSRVEPTTWWAGLPVRWICMDQRGCGRSQPRGHTAHNTLSHLVEDIELLRVRLGLERWAVAAGSWGAFVALAYAARWPERVAGLFLRSAFLGSDSELAHYLKPWGPWLGEAAPSPGPGQALAHLYQGRSFDAWQADTALSLGTAFDALGPLAAAFEVAQSNPGGIEASGVRHAPASMPAWTDDAAADWRVHVHYAATRWTVGHDAWAWAWAGTALSAVTGPVHLVHGARDAVCPIDTSIALARLCPHAATTWVAEGGHAMVSPPMRTALRAAAQAWTQLLRQAQTPAT